MSLQLLVNGSAAGAVIAISAMGFALVSGTTKGLHLAHGAVVVAGGLVAILLARQFLLAPVVAIAIAAACCACVGMAIERVVYWPLSRGSASRSTLLLASLGVHLTLTGILAVLFGQTSQFLQAQADATRIGDAFLARMQQIQLLFGIGIGASVVILLRYTGFGQLLRAQADDPELFAIVGGRPRRIRLVAAALGSALAGTAGALIGLDVGMDAQYGLGASITAAVATMVAGPNLTAWPVLSGVSIGLLQAGVGAVIAAKWVGSVTYALLVVFLLRRSSLVRRAFMNEGRL